jgi:PhoPQ-activated pathogenicity-related protein
VNVINPGALDVVDHSVVFRVFRRGLPLVIAIALLINMPETAVAGLDEYVKSPDAAFAWSQVATKKTPAGTIYQIKLTSQVWHGITWNHDLRIYEPREILYPDAALLYVTGGSTTSVASENDHKMGFALAQLCGSRVAVLPQVPNQPLFDGKTEDALISETFVRYLESKDESWPLLFPMVKSAVRAIDTIQAWAKKEGKPAINRFIVTGGSKRGWTTWLTGASDDRVVAIAPMVIVMLNTAKQGANSLKVWGQYSEQIQDYVDRGLTEKVQTPTGANLWKMVDPYSYRDRLTKPKLLINGTNDRYWTLDALDLYWDGLKGPKYLIEVPNSGHNLEPNRHWAHSGIGAFFRQVISNRPLPKLTWELTGADPSHATLTIHASPAPKAARLWTAKSATRDFRESRWESSNLEIGETIKAEVRPTDGHMALYGELQYEVDGIPYHLTTSFFEPGQQKPSIE